MIIENNHEEPDPSSGTQQNKRASEVRCPKGGDPLHIIDLPYSVTRILIKVGKNDSFNDQLKKKKK